MSDEYLDKETLEQINENIKDMQVEHKDNIFDYYDELKENK